MKKRFATRLLSLLLCFCMVVPVLASCAPRETNPPQSTELSWAATDDQCVTLDMTVNKNDTTTSLVLSYGEDVFSALQKDQIRLLAFRLGMTEGETPTVQTYTSTITDFTATVDNAKQMTITVANHAEADGYMVLVHSTALGIGKFGEAQGFINADIKPNTYGSAKIEGTYAMGDTDPVITVLLENTLPSEKFNKEMITLGGLFSELTIDSATLNGNRLTITTKGMITYASPFMGEVVLSAAATYSATKLSATTDVICRTSYIDQKSFTLVNGELCFKAILVSDTTTLAVNDQITEDGITYTVKAVSDDKTEITFGTAATQTELDKAIEAYSNKTLTIPAEKTASGNSLCIIVYANRATVSAVIDYIGESDTANTYQATLIVSIKNGEWSRELTAADITFGDDLEGAVVTSVKKTDKGYEVAIRFTATDLDVDQIAILGTIILASTVAKNEWGTALIDAAAEMTYIVPADRKVTVKGLIEFVKESKGHFDTIKEIADTVSKINITDIAGTAKNVQKILQLAGIIETPKKTSLDTLKKQIEDVQRSIVELDQKLDIIGSQISAGTADTITSVHYNTYVSASAKWSSFVSDYIIPLQDKIAEFNVAFNEYVLHYIGKAHTDEGAVSVYIDSTNSVTLPHPINNSYSVDGYTIAQSGKYKVSAELSGVISKMMANRGRLYDGYWDDIAGEATDIVALNNGESISTEEYILAVQMSASMYAMEQVGATEIINAYTNFCKALAGHKSSAAMKPLDSYVALLSVYYNFFGEAREDLETTMAWISGLLIETTGIAALACELTPAVQDGIIGESFQMALERIEDASKERDDRFSFIANKVVSSAKLKAHVGDLWNPGNAKCIQYGLYNTFTELYMDGSVFAPDRHVNDTQMLMMIKRYENLKRLGIINAPSFQSHLATLNILPEYYMCTNSEGKLEQPVRFLTDDVTVKKLPFDKTVSLEVWYSVGSSIKVGKTEKYGAHGKQSNYQIAEEILGNVVYQDGTAHHGERLYASVVYYKESKFKNWLIDKGFWVNTPYEMWIGSYSTGTETVVLTLQ